MSVFSPEPEYTVPLGEGFQTKTYSIECLKKYNLIGVDVLTFVNTLCSLVDNEKDEVTLEEWHCLEFTLRAFMVTYDSGELYFYLLHSHGPDAINYRAWVHFANDSSWPICVRTFTDMPTEMLEEYAAKDWQRRIQGCGDETKRKFMEAIGKRTDIYGQDSLPLEMVEGILFGKP